MARPRSDDKRDAILSAAISVFAEGGLSAPTSAVSKSAGVAEGTLFTYFPTKDDLLNAIYRQIKLELAEVLMSGFGRKKDLRAKLQHIWDAYVTWGLANPEERKALAQLVVSGKLTKETKAVGAAPFAEVEVMAREAINQGMVRDFPLEFILAIMEALTQATIDLMAANPSHAAKYRRFGFEALWNGLRKT
ncbi:MAG TPA: TetR/AcrR family transcriptional regulator [Bryobacteraceae bacterium]|jgi:AcrR family transcriptional regulator|nr:TetR/AcrR family transcriptional regulator [Bryobacteraceae bacterium]